MGSKELVWGWRGGRILEMVGGWRGRGILVVACRRSEVLAEGCRGSGVGRWVGRWQEVWREGSQGGRN